MLIDLHTHSTVSDGTDSPEELVAAAKRADLDVVALCDHDTMEGVPAAQRAGLDCGVTVLRGVEVSTELDGATVHLLGYGCDPTSQGLADALTSVREGRRRRLDKMLGALHGVGIELTIDDVLRQTSSISTVGRPHVADALVAAGLVRNRGEAFAEWLDVGRPGYVPHPRLPLEDALHLVREAGGVTVLAHAWRQGSRHVLGPGVIAGLAASGWLDGLEVDHQKHTAADREALRQLAADIGLIPTGSSDYHGTGKINHDLGCNTTPESSYRAILALIDQRGGCR